MPFGGRVANGVGTQATSDLEFGYFVLNDASAALTVGMPVYLDVTDSGEFNVLNSATLVSGAGSQTRSMKRVVLGLNANAGRLAGIYQPDSLNVTPAIGTVIKCLLYGPGLVSAAAKASGTAVTVGATLIGDSTQNSLLAGAASLGNSAAQVTATSTFVAKGTAIIAVPGTGVTTRLVNAFVNIQ